MPVSSQTDEPNEDNPITLKDACEIVFKGAISPWTLRAEAERGNLEIMRIGKRDFTTIRLVREMMDKCRRAPRDQGSTPTRNGTSGLSETDQRSSAHAAALATVEMLKRL